jgi:hypothetical protein
MLWKDWTSDEAHRSESTDTCGKLKEIWGKVRRSVESLCKTRLILPLRSVISHRKTLSFSLLFNISLSSNSHFLQKIPSNVDVMDIRGDLKN